MNRAWLCRHIRHLSDDVSFGSVEPLIPQCPQLSHRQACLLLLAALGSESIFRGIRRDAVFPGEFFNLVGASRKLHCHGFGNLVDIPRLAFATNVITQLPHLHRHASMKRRFKIWSIAFEISKLSGLPCLFFLVPRCVHHETMCMNVSIGFAVDGSGGLVNELRPHEIAGGAIRIDSMPPHASLRFAFDLMHRLIDTVAKGRQYPIIHP